LSSRCKRAADLLLGPRRFVASALAARRRRADNPDPNAAAYPHSDADALLPAAILFFADTGTDAYPDACHYGAANRVGRTLAHRKRNDIAETERESDANRVADAHSHAYAGSGTGQ
jgi:hypothetical protein